MFKFLKIAISQIKLAKKINLSLGKGFANPTHSDTIKYHNILFCPLNSSSVNTIRESLIAKKCELHNAKTTILFHKYRQNFSYYYDSTKGYLGYRFKIFINEKFIKIINLKSKTLSKGIKKSEVSKICSNIKIDSSLENFIYKGVKIGDLVVADTIRDFQCPKPLWDDTKFIEKLKIALHASLELFESYDSLLKENKFDKIVMSHGIYSLWGILFRIARKRNIPVDVYNSSYRKDTLRFYHNLPNAPMPLEQWNKTYHNIPLTTIELNEVDRYIKSRDDQREDNVTLFNENKNNKEQELKQFIKTAQENNSKVACVFTNIAWDAYSFSGENIFPSIEEWFIKTVNYFSKSNHYLIVKAHPAEDYFNVPEEYRIKALFKKLKTSSNILFLDEYANVKSTFVYKYIDIGITYISTVALEMALLNKSVITAGKGGQYSNKGFTIDPINEEDYFSKIELIMAGNAGAPDIEMAKKYLFYRFYREAIPFNIITLKDLYSIKNIDFDNFEKFTNNKYLNHIKNGILNDSDFIMDSSLFLNDN